MNLKKWQSQTPATLILFAGLLFGSNTMAVEKQALMIDIETDSVHIQELDISHLTPGDTETIYTEDGRVVDVMRKEQGVDIFIDGERLDLPAFSHDPHTVNHEEIRQVMLRIECDEESEPDCAEHLTMHEGWAGADEHDAKHVVIIKKVAEEEDDI